MKNKQKFLLLVFGKLSFRTPKEDVLNYPNLPAIGCAIRRCQAGDWHRNLLIRS